MWAENPNIIVILADDMGFSDIGSFGSEIRTPALDSMAQNGVRFTQMYNCARCCPTRASLLTGLYPHQAGVGHMINDRGVGPEYQGYLRSDCVYNCGGAKTARICHLLLRQMARFAGFTDRRKSGVRARNRTQPNTAFPRIRPFLWNIGWLRQLLQSPRTYGTGSTHLC